MSALSVHRRWFESAGARCAVRCPRRPLPASLARRALRYLSVTDTDTGVLVLPAESVAVTEIVWLPTAALRAFHFMEYGALVSLPSSFPSTWKLTLATPLLSVALAFTVIVPRVRIEPCIGDVIVTAGALVSLKTT